MVPGKISKSHPSEPKNHSTMTSTAETLSYGRHCDFARQTPKSHDDLVDRCKTEVQCQDIYTTLEVQRVIVFIIVPPSYQSQNHNIRQGDLISQKSPCIRHRVAALFENMTINFHISSTRRRAPRRNPLLSMASSSQTTRNNSIGRRSK